MHLTVREVDRDVFREFKAESVRSGIKLGKALSLAMEYWLRKTKMRKKISLLDYKPEGWGEGTKHTSQEIDKIIYGE